MVSALCLWFAGSGVCCGIFKEVLHTVLVNEQIRLRVASDSNDVLVVVLNPAANFFAIDEFDDDGCFAFREAVDVFGLAERGLRRGLPSIPPARVFVGGAY